MAERSFVEEVEKLRLSAGEEFHGEAILAVTKALLQSGVSYIGGYQGAPISHLLDVFADANALLEELGVRFETSARAVIPVRPPIGTRVSTRVEIRARDLSRLLSRRCIRPPEVIPGQAR